MCFLHIINYFWLRNFVAFAICAFSDKWLYLSRVPCAVGAATHATSMIIWRTLSSALAFFATGGHVVALALRGHEHLHVLEKRHVNHEPPERRW